MTRLWTCLTTTRMPNRFQLKFFTLKTLILDSTSLVTPKSQITTAIWWPEANFLSAGSITLRMTQLNASAQLNNSMVLEICIGLTFMTSAAFCRCRSGIRRIIRWGLRFGIKLMGGQLLRLLINMTPIMRSLRPDGGWLKTTVRFICFRI